MQFSVTFRQMEAADAVKEYAREKLSKIKKYFPDPIMTHVVFSVERGYQHVADVSIQLHNGLAIKGREATEDVFSSIDLVMAKIERQVRRYKDKIRNHKPRTSHSAISVAHHIIEGAVFDREQDVEAPANEKIVPKTVPDLPPSVIKTEKLEARPLSVQEAVMQLNLLHDSFLVFRNGQTGKINVVYKLRDGNYGLIEAEQA